RVDDEGSPHATPPCYLASQARYCATASRVFCVALTNVTLRVSTSPPCGLSFRNCSATRAVMRASRCSLRWPARARSGTAGTPSRCRRSWPHLRGLGHYLTRLTARGPPAGVPAVGVHPAMYLVPDDGAGAMGAVGQAVDTRHGLG